MKQRNKIILCVFGGLLLIWTGSFQFSRSNTSALYGDFTFPKGLKIEKVAVRENGQIFRIVQVGPSGATLENQITRREIHVPWTLYLPFYQLGTISGRLVYDAQVLDNHWTSLSVSISESTTRYAIIPKVFRKEEIGSRLVDTMVKAAEVRISESQK